MAVLLEDVLSPVARDFWSSLTGNDEVIAPALLFPECTSVIRNRVHRLLLTETEGAAIMRELLRMPISIMQSTEQFTLAYAFATRLGRVRAYDTQYLAVARLGEASLVTLDGGMHQAAVELGISARLLR